MNIAFFEIENWEKKYLRKKLKSHSLIFFDHEIQESDISKLKKVDVISPFIYSKVTKKELDKLPNLKLIATRSTGFDHINIKECNKRKIIVTNVPTYGANTVAEHTFALILSLTRKIHHAWDRTRMLNFSREGLRGTDLQGKTLGVIGTGNIGRHVIRMARGFEMNVIAFDVYKNPKAAKELGFSYKSFNYLLKKSDIVSLHCPYNPKTYHLINKKNITQMKKNSLIINTSRGGLIETDALLHALQKKHLAGAGLDVLEEECHVQEDTEVMHKKFPPKCDLRIILENHALAKMENVIITPHNAFNSIEALERILDTTIENILAFQRKKPMNKV